ncbi:MAG: MMPL family transporter [Saprospiraceae bacterium]|nr:MMPL family transporter [Lewinella sp.]
MKIRIAVIALFIILAGISSYYIFQLKFAFDFEQFFPKGDPDLEVFREFIKDFETDDNFMLIALRRPEGAFEQDFLKKVHDLTLKSRELPYVQESQSLTKFGYPVKTPFGITTIPAIHIDRPELYEQDRQRLIQDERFVYNLISPDGNTLVVYLKMIDGIQLAQAREFMKALDALIDTYDFPEYHYMGRPYFQKELVAMQQREVTISALISGLLVSIVMFFIFRRAWGIFVALISIGLGMLLFFGLLGATGRELNAMSALYPVLMIIVGTSDVIHIMSKYVDELRKGHPKDKAIVTTIREIGLATLLTSLTTAIGFCTLLTSRIGPIRDFGVNAAVGVVVAYITVILFTTALLSFFHTDQIVKLGRSQLFWENLLEKTYRYTISHRRGITWGTLILTVLCAVGISQINTNYNVINNLPRGEKITKDFIFFEKELTGFRPMEFAVYAQGDHLATDWEVVQEIEKIEDHLRKFDGIRAISSVTALYKSINQMNANNRQDAYALPETESKFRSYRRLVDQMPKLSANVMLSKDRKKARITSRILDMGSDTIKVMGQRIDDWIATAVDTSLVEVDRTGTGLIIDKNAEYVRRNLLEGLGVAVIIISLLMALLFRNWRMLIISIIPNLIPLLLAGALLGYLSIELEAGVAIVFAVIFGIAVDDSIHFLSKYKLTRVKGIEREEAIRITFRETGKAIILTSLILFFGFLVMLFSIHPPSVVIGLLISITLISALLSDLLLIPLLIRWLRA